MTLQTFDCLNLTDIILNNDADTIMDAIRIAASECHGAISLLTKRSKTDVDGLVRFSTDTGRMLIAVGLLRDKLHSTDQWIDKTYKKIHK